MKPAQKLTLSINPLYVIIILVLIIAGMLAVWRPWEGSKQERTITSTGQADVESTPDEFTFSPYFQRTGTDTAALKTALDAYGNTLLAELIKLGVNKDDVTLHSSSNSDERSIEPAMPGGATKGKPSDSQNVVTLSVTIKAPSQELAQKVQNYLATTDAKGQLTSQPSFSKAKRQKLENEARDKATVDAKEKAERSAKNLGGSIGKVITIKESQGGSIYPLSSGAPEDTARSSLPVTPGKNSVSSSVEVVFELR